MLTVVLLLNLFMATCYTNEITNNDENEWMLFFNDTNVNQLEMGSSMNIVFYARTNTSWTNENLKIQVISSDEDVAYTKHQFFDLPRNHGHTSSEWLFSFNLTTEFIGYAKLNLRVVELGELVYLLPTHNY